tara:strand:+ start:565 stop:981 length:417 start_codon:yes stop_codon:yes gene_type:complete
MHASIIVTFILDAGTSKRWMGYIVSLSAFGILWYDMYGYPQTHNILTALTMVLAVFNLIYYSDRKERPIVILTCSVGSVVFLLGVLTDIHIFFAEVVAEFAIAIGILRRIWIGESPQSTKDYIEDLNEHFGDDWGSYS